MSPLDWVPYDGMPLLSASQAAECSEVFAENPKLTPMQGYAVALRRLAICAEERTDGH